MWVQFIDKRLVDIIRCRAVTRGPRSGQHAKAQEALEQILKVNRQRQVDAEYLVQAYMGVGNYDQALTWLEWAASHQPNVLTSIKVEPIYDRCEAIRASKIC